ncbi:MAG: hypothetical protein NE327_06495 [Lentisphaeraceae bacterium]|nr:hypothetical protein [Lentisphaeraceae bacterium]
MKQELKIDPQLLETLCCPKCKGQSELVPVMEKPALVCSQCSTSYKLKEVPGPHGQGMFIPELLVQDED